MKIHEFQAKQLLRDAGVPVPEGIVARSAEEARQAYADLGGTLAVVKAQIHAGGRGKGSTAENPEQHGGRFAAFIKTSKDVMLAPWSDFFKSVEFSLDV